MEIIPKKRCRKKAEKATSKYWCIDLFCRKAEICPISVAYKGKDNFWDHFDKLMDKHLFNKENIDGLSEVDP